MGEPGNTPASSGCRRTFEEALEEKHHGGDSTLSSSSLFTRSRSVRRRVDFDHSSALPAPEQSIVRFPHTVEFVVYLPNRISVEVQVLAEVCRNLSVQGFVKLVKMELGRTKLKQPRGIVWGDHVEVQDFQGTLVKDGEFASSYGSKTGRVLLLYDKHPDTVHAHPGFWNVTPEPHMLEVLPQDYTLFSALADELDNSLQAVYQLQPGKQRLICVNLDHKDGKISIYDTGKGMDGTPGNCIAKWGTLGSSTNRHVVPEAIGGDPPYLKPNFGMYGFGGISAGFHLGGSITVSSKTETSHRVAILHLGRKSLAANVKSGSVWKTGGEFRSPTEQELQWSPHGSFTKVEISDLNRKVSTWKVEEVQRKLKDYYFPYIQNDEGNGETVTTRPVEIRVNGEDLAGVVGGEVAHSNYHSGPGEPFVIILEFTKLKDMDGSGDTVDRANARITCHYFPISQGREAIDDIIDQLKEEDSDFMENFESFSRRAIRRLGRLLPDARGGRLPFMEPKRIFRINEVNRHCYKRVKAFIDVDAGFIPTQSKMDLIPKNPFTEALLHLGLGLQTVDTAKITLKKAGPVAVSIKRWNTEPEHQGWVTIKPEHLHAEYTTWIKKQHESFDVAVIVNENSLVVFTQPQNKKELNITKDVFRVVYGIKCKGIDWKVGKEEPPIHLKLLKGIPGLNNNDKSMFVTVECFISEGLPDDQGDTRIICRPIEIPEERGSRGGLDEEDQIPYFTLGESRAFPMEILFTEKHEEVPEAAWLKRLDLIQNKLPTFIELLNEREVMELAGHRSLLQHTNFKAGAALPDEIIAVVRPSSCKRGASFRLEQKYIIAECMEMMLVVREMKVKGTTEAETRVYQAKTTACTRKNWKGLYCFSTTNTILESVTRAIGTYEFKFILVSAKYQEVDEFKLCINVTPSSTIGHWNICSHSELCSDHHPNRSPEAMKVRLGGVLPGPLYLTRVDEFSNPMEFTEIPANLKGEIFSIQGDRLLAVVALDEDRIKIADADQLSVQIPRIEVGGGNLAPLKPTMEAELRISIADTVVASFSISVFPGGIASARLKEGEVPENRLKPGQTIAQIVFEALDKYGNLVSSGEKVKLVLKGFELQDKNGYMRSMDENGSLDLGMRLKVIAGYGETARVEVRSTEDEFLWETTFDIIDRKLRVRNEPDHVAVGSQLRGIAIEALDEDGQLDETMDGTAHTLTLDWNPNIAVPLHNGRCTLPPIQMPSTSELWKGCVAHTQNPELQTFISVWVEEISERNVDNSPPNIPGSSEIPAALPQSPEPRAYVRRNTAAPEVPHHDERKKFVQAERQATAEWTKNLEGRMQRLEKKAMKNENDYKRLKQVKKDHEESMKRYKGELDVVSKKVKFEPSTSDAIQEQPAEGRFSTFALTLAEVEMKVSKLGHPPRTHAAAILLQAQQERYSEIMDAEGILGIVTLLGAVEGESLNRALVEFLGLENMLAIICSSVSAAECIGIPHFAGAFNNNKGLSGFARSHNLRISGRFRVIALTDESSFYKCSNGSPAVNKTHPQKLLNIGPVIKPGSERLVGSLGYAVNMIHLNEEQLRMRIAGHGLRESLFFLLFGYLEVFDTTNNMIRARNNIRTTAVSLDGGLIRARNQFELGSREDPVVWFPAVQQHDASSKPRTCENNATPLQRFIPKPVQISMNTTVKQKELKQRMAVAQQRYHQAGVEDDLRKVTDRLKRITEKMTTLKELITSASPVLPTSKPPENLCLKEKKDLCHENFHFSNSNKNSCIVLCIQQEGNCEYIQTQNTGIFPQMALPLKIPTPKTGSEWRTTKMMKLPSKRKRPPPKPLPKGKIMKNSPLLEAFLKRKEEPENNWPKPPPSPTPVGYSWGY